ncbi:MAG: hypothetical protein IKL80_05130, partial [Clostridia bacterium]|nr:hypothetical protein [Clostridia bacterium]
DQERYTFPWYVGAEGLEKEEAFDRLVNDPRYLTEIRPELERLGFEFCYEEGRNELANAIDNMYIHGGSTPAEEHHPGGIADNFLKLHGAMAGMDAAVLYESCYEVAKKHYPDIYYGNYQSYVMPEETEPGLSPQGYIYGYTRGLKAGNFSNQETYGWNYLAALNLKNFVPDYPYPYYHNTTYNSMLGDFRLFQRSSMYTQNNQEVAWLCNYSYLWNERTIGRTAYWDEFVFHTFMSSSLPFACYYPESVKTAQEDYYTSETLYELDELCGFEERTPLFEETVPFDSKYILSGMNCGGRNVWRITPDLCYEDFTIEDFLYDEENLIFKIGNQFVDFPEGSFIYTPEYKPEHKERSYFGYWVITPEGTRPTEYRDESLPIMPEPDILIDAAQTHLTKLQKKQANSVAMAKANNEY